MRAQMKLLCLLGCLLAWVPHAFGQAKATTKSQCENTNSQLEMNQCWAAAYKAVDAELNTL
jgi:uncharacterized protein YecT (DUF1311 family)